MDKLYIFGLENPDKLEDSVYVADPSVKKLFKIDLDSKPSCARKNFSFCCSDQYKFYIFGGINTEEELMNTVEVFDITQYQWQVIETKGISPSPRQGHSAVIIDNHMFIFGGTPGKDLENADP